MVTASPAEAMDGFGTVPEANFCAALDPCLVSAIVAINSHRQIVAFNSAAESLLGRPVSGMLNRPLELLPGPLRDALLETLLTGQPLPERQIRIPVRNGETLTLRITTTALCDSKSQPLGAIGVLNDFNPDGGLHNKLRQLDRLASIGTLSVGMGHEIKNALVAVRAFVDLLLAENQQSKLADVVSREMRRIDTLVTRMLRGSAPDKQAFVHLNVHQVLEQSLELIQRELTDRQITLDRSLQASTDLVLGDGCQLEQAFLNLFLNALDAMGANARLSVATSILPPGAVEDPRGPLLQITIADSGSGIPQEIQGRLFEPFFTTKPNGTGLGLAITRRIIEEHRGTIRVESQIQRGTTFFLLLPLARQSEGER